MLGAQQKALAIAGALALQVREAQACAAFTFKRHACSSGSV